MKDLVVTTLGDKDIVNNDESSEDVDCFRLITVKPTINGKL